MGIMLTISIPKLYMQGAILPHKMGEGTTTISVKQTVRDELRRYKAEDGLTYDEAIARLLEESGWIENQNQLLNEVEP